MFHTVQLIVMSMASKQLILSNFICFPAMLCLSTIAPDVSCCIVLWYELNGWFIANGACNLFRCKYNLTLKIQVNRVHLSIQAAQEIVENLAIRSQCLTLYVARILLSTGPSASDMCNFCENQDKTLQKPLDSNWGQKALLRSSVLSSGLLAMRH